MGSPDTTFAPEASLVIREVTPADVPAIQALERTAMASVGIEYSDADDHSLVRDFQGVQEAYLDKGGTLLVGEIDGEVVAMGALNRQNDRRGKIERMSTRPGLQQRGFGRQILSALERQAEGTGLAELVLTTSDQQQGAVRLYEGLGYEKYGREMPHRDGYKLLFFKKRLHVNGSPEPTT